MVNPFLLGSVLLRPYLTAFVVLTAVFFSPLEVKSGKEKEDDTG